MEISRYDKAVLIIDGSFFDGEFSFPYEEVFKLFSAQNLEVSKFVVVCTSES